MDLPPIDRRALAQGMRLWTWAAPDGWKHRRLDWPQPEDWPARGSLLFVGGRGDFVEKYVEALTEWHRRGWQVASFDWRGQGQSKGDIVSGHFDSFDILIDDLAALVDDWSLSSPPPHVVVAHSMGGHMLLRLIIARRPKLAAAVLVAPMIRVNSGLIPAWLAPLIAAAATRLGFSRRPLWGAPLARAPAGSKRQRVLTSCPDRYEDEAFWWDRHPDHASSAPTFGWLNAAYRSGRAFTPAALGAVDLPILLLGAEQDALVSAAAIRRTARLLPGAELMMLPDSAHEILRERDDVRQRAMARIDRFLEQHAS
jgi:lysophospholipase